MNFTQFKKLLEQKKYYLSNNGIYSNGAWIAVFNYDTNVAEYCCGGKEIGAFQLYTRNKRIYGENDLPKKGSLNYYCLLGVIAEALLRLKTETSDSELQDEDYIEMKHMGEKKFPGKKYIYSVYFHTNGQVISNLIEEAIKTFIPQHYKAVHQVINPNSGNLITLWATKY